jgi:hypothetical protein
MGDELWSGWGVRTMSTGDAAYNPLSYHNGTVWPHDNSLIAWGLARYARWPEAQRIVQRMLTPPRTSTTSCRRSSPGCARAETPFPIAYPTAARPQAWAAGRRCCCCRCCSACSPTGAGSARDARAAELPSWAGDVRLTGVRAFDRRGTCGSSTAASRVGA